MLRDQGRWRWLMLAMMMSACAQHSMERRDVAVTSSVIQKAVALGLVDVRAELPDVAVDLRYSTADNITQRKLYPTDMPCLVRRSTAQKLKRVQARLQAEGCSLCIWDAWRPPEVQLELMRKGGETGMFLDPKVQWSRHCSGVALDVTLVDLKGGPMRLPTAHDEHSDRAYYQYSGTDSEVKRNLNVLQEAMSAEGFSMIPMEWWHFDDYEWFDNPPSPVFAKQIQLALPEN